MIEYIHLMNSISQSSTQSATDLYSMCVVCLHEINSPMQNYFADQRYQLLRSESLTKHEPNIRQNVQCNNCSGDQKK